MKPEMNMVTMILTQNLKIFEYGALIITKIQFRVLITEKS